MNILQLIGRTAPLFEADISSRNNELADLGLVHDGSVAKIQAKALDWQNLKDQPNFFKYLTIEAVSKGKVTLNKTLSV